MSEPATRAAGAAEARAGYHIPINHFAGHALPPGGHAFESERAAVLGSTPLGRVLGLDRSQALGLPFPATTPTMLASYASLNAGQAVDAGGPALACLCYVIRGTGLSVAGTETLRWGPGDLMVLPAASGIRHIADSDALLYCVTDEPLWRYLGVRALSVEAVGAVHYPAAIIAREMKRLEELSDQEAVGRAVIFTRDGLHEAHLTTPFFIANINTLEAGDDQRTHRHNGAALTLSIDGEGCHSVVGDDRVDWTPFGVMVTPAGFAHSHHNRGPRTMISLVVQDSGLYQHTGVTGFAFDPQADARLARAEKT